MVYTKKRIPRRSSTFYAIYLAKLRINVVGDAFFKKKNSLKMCVLACSSVAVFSTREAALPAESRFTAACLAQKCRNLDSILGLEALNHGINERWSPGGPRALCRAQSLGQPPLLPALSPSWVHYSAAHYCGEIKGY